jgi:hypothetical protein
MGGRSRSRRVERGTQWQNREVPDDRLNMGDVVYIADLPEARAWANREGTVYGHTKPSSSGQGPVIGARKGHDVDFAWSVYFEDTGEQEWFAPHLVKLLRQK